MSSTVLVRDVETGQVIVQASNCRTPTLGDLVDVDYDGETVGLFEVRWVVHRFGSKEFPYTLVWVSRCRSVPFPVERDAEGKPEGPVRRLVNDQALSTLRILEGVLQGHEAGSKVDSNTLRGLQNIVQNLRKELGAGR